MPSISLKALGYQLYRVVREGEKIKLKAIVNDADWPKVLVMDFAWLKQHLTPNKRHKHDKAGTSNFCRSRLLAIAIRSGFLFGRSKEEVEDVRALYQMYPWSLSDVGKRGRVKFTTIPNMYKIRRKIVETRAGPKFVEFAASDLLPILPPTHCHWLIGHAVVHKHGNVNAIADCNDKLVKIAKMYKVIIARDSSEAQMVEALYCASFESDELADGRGLTHNIPRGTKERSGYLLCDIVKSAGRIFFEKMLMGVPSPKIKKKEQDWLALYLKKDRSKMSREDYNLSLRRLLDFAVRYGVIIGRDEFEVEKVKSLYLECPDGIAEFEHKEGWQRIPRFTGNQKLYDVYDVLVVDGRPQARKIPEVMPTPMLPRRECSWLLAHACGRTNSSLNHRHGSRGAGRRRCQKRLSDIAAKYLLVVARNEVEKEGVLNSLQVIPTAVLQERYRKRKVAEVTEGVSIKRRLWKRPCPPSRLETVNKRLVGPVCM